MMTGVRSLVLSVLLVAWLGWPSWRCGASAQSWPIGSVSADSRQIRTPGLYEEAKRFMASERKRSPDRMLQLRKRLAGRPTVNKRHCWDVADICCMWNVC